MSDNKRKCAQCGLELDPVSGLCAYCETEAVRELGRKLREPTIRQPTQIRDILTGPPTPDDLAAAATVCERLTVHLENEIVEGGKKLNWERKTILQRKSHYLRNAIAILKSFLIVFLFIVGCSNDVADETDITQYDDPDSELTTGYARTEEPDAGTVDEPEPTEEPDAGTVEEPEPTEEPDAGTVEEPEPTEEPDAAIDESEEPDAHIDPQCAFTGTWSVRFVQGTLCISQNDPLVLEIADCDQTDFERSLNLSDPTFGDFAGSITYHVDFENQDSFTGTADIVGTVTRSGQESPCSSVATISGGRDETKESS
jgi:hypothetical protein